MLALLGTSSGLRRSRAWLQDKLWSDRDQEHGAASLRQALTGMRQSLGEDRGCIVTEQSWVALDPAQVSVLLEPEPEDWDLTGEPPEFCEGLDIADPEFEDWLRDQRTACEERLAELERPSHRRGVRGARRPVRRLTPRAPCSWWRRRRPTPRRCWRRRTCSRPMSRHRWHEWAASTSGSSGPTCRRPATRCGCR